MGQQNSVATVEATETEASVALDGTALPGADLNLSFVRADADDDQQRAYLSDYRLLKAELGEGAFGTVRLAQSATTGHQVAVKIIKRSKMRDRSELLLQREVKHHERLRHANVVRLYTWIKTPSRYYLVMEHCDRGDLLRHINASPSRLPDAEVRSLFRQLVEGLRFCHSIGVFHRDIKLENLMLCSSSAGGGPVLKIADFGLSTLMTAGFARTHCGSPLYASPELLGAPSAEGGPVDPDAPYDPSKSDMWATGVVLYALLASELPFDGDDMGALVRMIVSGKPSTPVPAERGEAAAQLVEQLLQRAPEARPSADEVLRHAYLEQPRRITEAITVETGLGLAAAGLGSGADGSRRRTATQTTDFFKKLQKEEDVAAAPSGGPSPYLGDRYGDPHYAGAATATAGRQPGAHLTKHELEHIRKLGEAESGQADGEASKKPKRETGSVHRNMSI